MNPSILFYLLFLILFVHNIQVSLGLQQLVNITEQPKVQYVVLKPGEIYQHHSDYLDPLPYVNSSCKSVRGEIIENKIVAFPEGKIVDNVQHVYVQKYGTIYRLEHQSLIAYQFSEGNKKLTQIQTLDFGNSHCKGQIALSNDQEYLYYFACQKVTKIQMKKSLTDVKTIEIPEAFYGYKVISGPDCFIWASYNEGLRVYVIDSYHNLQLMQTLQKFEGNAGSQKVADVAFRDNKLYVLGMNTLIFIYERVGNGTFVSESNISLANICTECNHREILVHNKNIYIYSVEKGQQFVSELQYQKQFSKINLIRYFKGNRNLAYMSIFEGKLMLGYSHAINLYEINKDPRTITRLLNGVSNVHVDEMNKMERISQRLFVKTNDKVSQIVRLSIKKPYYQCQYEQQFKQARRLQVIQPCQQFQNINQQRYYYHCSVKDIINISVQKQKQSIHLLAVISVFLFCTAIVIILMIWRKGKIDLIENIVIQINKLKKKNNENIEFVQEKGSVKQTNWNDIQESYGVEEKYQIQQEQKQGQNELKEEQPGEIEEGEIQGTQRNMVQIK